MRVIDVFKREKKDFVDKYKPLVDKIKGLKDVNVKEEIKKRDYVNNEDIKLNKTHQLSIYKMQVWFLSIVVLLEIVMILFPFIKENYLNFTLLPNSVLMILGLVFLIIIAVNDLLSIKTNFSNKRIEAFHAISSGLEIVLILIEALIFVGNKAENIALASNSYIFIGILAVAEITSITKYLILQKRK